MSDAIKIVIPADTPDTIRFQLQLGRDGACRLVLLRDEADEAIAILTLDDERAQRLSEEIADRHETYARSAKSKQPKSNH